VKALPLVIVAGVLTGFLVGCGQSWDDQHGLGDAPVGNADDSPADVIQFPDRIRNVLDKCDGHGHRVYSSSAGPFWVIADPTCPGGKSE